MKFNKKKIAAILAALGALVALAQQFLSAVPDAPAPEAPAAVVPVAADAGVAQ